MHPPAQWFCSEHPSQDWELNDALSIQYYPATIPDPTTNHLVVAPFVCYSIGHAKSEVAVTFGLGYPVHSHIFQVVPVDYPCLSLTPDQITIFDSFSPLAPKVNQVIDTHFLIYLSAKVQRYQYFKEAQYAAQHCIKDLKDQLTRIKEREQQFFKQAMCSLDELKKANILGQLIAHHNKLIAELSEMHQGNFKVAIHGFPGPITQSSIDARPNPLCTLTHGVSPRNPRFVHMSYAEFDAETHRLQLKVREVLPEQPRIVHPWWELWSNRCPPATHRQLISVPW